MNVLPKVLKNVPVFALPKFATLELPSLNSLNLMVALLNPLVKIRLSKSVFDLNVHDQPVVINRRLFCTISRAQMLY